MKKYLIVIEKTAAGFSAYSPIFRVASLPVIPKER